MDGPELRPATRKRARAETRDAAPTSPDDRSSLGEVVGHLLAIESAVRAVDVRVEALERDHRSTMDSLRVLITGGFDEASSRALLLSELADDVAVRHDGALESIGRDVAATAESVAATTAEVGRVGEGIGEQLRASAAASDAIGVKLVSLERAVDRVGELHASMSTLAAQGRATAETVNGFEQRLAVIDTLGATISDLQATITDLRTATAATGDAVGVKLASLEGAVDRVGELHATMSALAVESRATAEAVNGFEARLATIDTLGGAITDLQATITELQTATAGAATQLRTAVDGLRAVDDGLATLTTRVEAAERSAAAVDARFARLQAMSDTVAELKAVVAALVTEVERNQEVVIDRVADVESLLKKARIRPVLRKGDES